MADRSGYTCDWVETSPSPYCIVTRDDGEGLGAFHSEEQVDEVIAEDKARQAEKSVAPEEVVEEQPVESQMLIQVNE